LLLKSAADALAADYLSFVE